MSGAVRSRKPLGQPVVGGPVLVVGGGMGGTPGGVGLMRGRAGGAAVALVAVAPAAHVPVVVGGAVKPLTTRVIAWSLIGSPVSLENLMEK